MDKWIIDNNNIFVNQNISKVSYPQDGNALYFQIEDSSPWFTQRNELIKTLIIKHKLKGNFLDIGGGNGFQIKALEQLDSIKETFLVEPGYNGCLNAKNREVKNVFCGLFQDFNFEKHNVNICGLFDVIEHIENDTKFLNELYEKIRKNTYVIINVPSLKTLWSEVDEMSGHFRRYNKKDINRILENTKFNLIDSGYHFFPYVIPLLILRVLPYKFGVKKSNKNIMKSESRNHNKKGLIQSFINFRNRQWIKKIARGRTPVFGTSMFLVLKK